MSTVRIAYDACLNYFQRNIYICSYIAWCSQRIQMAFLVIYMYTPVHQCSR